MVSRDELERIVLSPEERHLLAGVDGFRPLEAVCSMADMNPQDGATVLLDLVDRGVVWFL
jgi:hypothetical protein